jgi:hypothetical protein
MVWGAILGGAKKLLAGGGKKKAAPPKSEITKSEQLKGEATRTTKELLTPVRSGSARKPIRMRVGARKAMGRGSSRSGGR